jgi:hypothetical protein
MEKWPGESREKGFLTRILGKERSSDKNKIIPRLDIFLRFLYHPQRNTFFNSLYRSEKMTEKEV